MSLLSLDPVPLLETADSGLLLFRDNVQLNYNKIQDIVNKLDSANIKDGSIKLVDIALEDWVTFAPTVTQNVNVTFTSPYCKYFKFGRLVLVQGRLDITGAGTAGNNITVTTPFNVLPAFLGANPVLGYGAIFDLSAVQEWHGPLHLNGAAQFGIDATTGVAGLLGAASFVAGLAVGDQIFFDYKFEWT